MQNANDQRNKRTEYILTSKIQQGKNLMSEYIFGLASTPEIEDDYLCHPQGSPQHLQNLQRNKMSEVPEPEVLESEVQELEVMEVPEPEVSEVYLGEGAHELSQGTRRELVSVSQLGEGGETNQIQQVKHEGKP